MPSQASSLSESREWRFWSQPSWYEQPSRPIAKQLAAEPLPVALGGQQTTHSSALLGGPNRDRSWNLKVVPAASCVSDCEKALCRSESRTVAQSSFMPWRFAYS